MDIFRVLLKTRMPHSLNEMSNSKDLHSCSVDIAERGFVCESQERKYVSIYRILGKTRKSHSLNRLSPDKGLQRCSVDENPVFRTVVTVYSKKQQRRQKHQYGNRDETKYVSASIRITNLPPGKTPPEPHPRIPLNPATARTNQNYSHDLRPGRPQGRLKKNNGLEIS